jgi:PAS domain S-box-containing protein
MAFNFPKSGKRLIVSVYAGLFLLLFVVGIKGLVDQKRIHSAHQSIVNNSVVKLTLLRQARINVENLQSVTIDEVFHPSTTEKNAIARVRQLVALTGRVITDLDRLSENKKELQFNAWLKNAWEQYLNSRTKLYSLKDASDSGSLYYRNIQKLDYLVLHTKINNYIDEEFSLIRHKDDKINNYLAKSHFLGDILIIFVIAMLIALGILVIKTAKQLELNTRVLLAKEIDLMEAKSLYMDLFNKCPYPKWVCDKKTFQIHEVNEAALQLYGYTKAEFLQASVFDLKPAADREELRLRLLNLDFSKKQYKERRHQRKNGEIILVDLNLEEIFYKGMECVLMTVNDITETVLSRKAKHESEELYRSLFDNSPALICVCEYPSLKHLDVNETALQHYGYSREEFLSMTAFDLLPPEDHAALIERLEKNASPTGKLFYDRHLTKSGRIINVEIRVHLINYMGKKAGLVIALDITEKMKAEAERLKLDIRFRALVENSHEGIALHTADGRLLYASPSIERILGYSPEEVYNQKPSGLIHPEDFLKLKNLLQKLFGNPRKTETAEYRLLHKNGEWRWLRSNITNMLYEPAIQALVFNYEDITSARLAAEKMKESEEMYRSLFHNSPLPMFVADNKTLQYLEVNDAAVELYGYTREEFLRMSVFDIRTLQDHESLRDFIASESPALRNYHVKHLKKDGSTMIVDVNVDLMNYRGKEAFLSVIRDVTKTVRLQKQLQDEKIRKQVEITKATIQGQEKERNELAKELHDNVNQILATAKLYVEMSMNGSKTGTELLDRGKNLISSGIQEIRKICKSLVPPSLGETSLNEALNDLLIPFRMKNINIVVETCSLKECLLSDGLRTSVYRIIQEQLNNIMKYAEADEVKISLDQSEQELVLLVSDNGKGFDINRKRNGIGLTNIMNRAVTYNGKVIIDSAPGKGCRIKVNFSLLQDEKENSWHSEEDPLEFKTA